MSSCGPLDEVDESGTEFLENADVIDGGSGSYLYNSGSRTGLLEQFECSEDVPELFDCSGVGSSSSILDKDLFLEPDCLLSESLLSEADGFIDFGLAGDAVPFGVNDGNFENQTSIFDEVMEMTKNQVMLITSSSVISPLSEDTQLDATGFPDLMAMNPLGDEEKKHEAVNVLSSSRRSSRRSKSNVMPETGKSTARGRKSKNGLSPVGKTGSSLKIATRKRSCSSRRVRSSVWGSMGNVTQVFIENDRIPKHDNSVAQVDNQGSQKRKGGQRNERTEEAHVGGTSYTSKEKCRTSTSSSGRFRFKLKYGGKEVKIISKIVPDVLDNPSSVPLVVSKSVTEQDFKTSSESLNLDNGTVHKLEKNVFDSRQSAYVSGDFEKPVTSECAGVLDSQRGDKDLESTVTQDTSLGNTFGALPLIVSHKETRALEETNSRRYADSGTSPDSEVTNSIQDAGTSANAVLNSSQVVISPTDAAASGMELMSSKKGNNHAKVKGTICEAAERKLCGQGNRNKTEKSAKQGVGGKVRIGFNTIESSTLATTGNASSYSSSLEIRPNESHVVSETGRLESLEVETIIGSCALYGEAVGVKTSELQSTMGLPEAGKTMVPKCPSKSSSDLSKRRSLIPNSARSRRKDGCEQKEEKIGKSVDKIKAKKKGFPGETACDGEMKQETDGNLNSFIDTEKPTDSRGHTELNEINVAGNEICDFPGKSTVNSGAAEAVLKSSMIASELDEESLPPRKAWVLCDDCHKWRCISATLADSIGENDRWICKDNMDMSFADCSIPQEKTDAEINAELDISDEEDTFPAPVRVDPKIFDGKQLSVSQQAHWKPIDSNFFLHRSRKTQTIDEIMVCHCTSPQDGNLGCGEECLNRMLNIECVRGTCPCGDLCSNRQFQKRKYAKLEYFRCGKKGYGLRLLENVTRGKFLIEYVGEVLDLSAYEARQKEYAFRGQKHFYFMTLNGNEVIDACAKGNLGRFINHSCDPNCETEKWTVNGEVCIGLFAKRDIKKGEEVTFDYNYVRVFGAAAKKCVCGSSRCRGYIGADPLNTETIVHSDTDEEFPEPVMVNENGDSENCMVKRNFVTRFTDDMPVKHIDSVVKLPSVIKQLELSLQKEEIVSKSSYVVQPSEVPGPLSASAIKPLEVSQTEDVPDGSLSALQSEDFMANTLLTIKPLDASSRITDTVSKSLSDSVAANSETISNTDVDKPNIVEAHPQMKSSRSASSFRKGKGHSFPVTANRPQVLSNKPKKMLEGSSNSCLKGVEEKLNELLDADGGISKRKDSTKGYLKLLFFTATSGDNVSGEGFQSTRDLSIILDALLKTRSRMVLVDIINKNGLQMLHNIMKQNRKNFNKIPIIRKLLKVLTFLADKEILTIENINSGPSCAGVESFKESIMELAWHKDTKVHEIARSFRDRWFPRTKRVRSDRDEKKSDGNGGGVKCRRPPSNKRRRYGRGVRRNEATDCTNQVMVAGNVTSGVNRHKRKSRWEQPVESKPDRSFPEPMEVGKVSQQSETREVVQGRHVDEANGGNFCSRVSQSTEAASSSVDGMQDIDDVPPGFSSSRNSPRVSGNDSQTFRGSAREVHMGCHQERYLSQLPVSFGIPLVFAEQLGAPQAETKDGWAIAPSIPFHSFPPLPSYPRERSSALQPASDPGMPGKAGGWLQNAAAPVGANNQQTFDRTQFRSGGSGRRHSKKQRRYNNRGGRRCPPPWARRRAGSDNMWRNNSRGGGRNGGSENVKFEEQQHKLVQGRARQ